MRNMSSATGMTLLEMTIALSLVVVLTSFALPTYREYAARGHRQLAIDALHAVALDIEMVGGHGGSAGEHAATERDMAIEAIGVRWEWVPTASRPTYRLRIAPGGAEWGADAFSASSTSSRSASFYTIIAEPVVGGPQAQDRCGSYFLDASGRRGNRARAPASRQEVTQEGAMQGCWQGR